jgi:hypothetical protein
VGSNADVAELVDALDLGSSAARCGGSSPSIRTQFLLNREISFAARQVAIQAAVGSSPRFVALLSIDSLLIIETMDLCSRSSMHMVCFLDKKIPQQRENFILQE